MPNRNRDLHGSVPDASSVALLLIDVINDLEFPGGDRLLPFARRMARQIAALKRRANALDIPSIYVNDNFGRWRSDFRVQVTHCLGPVRGRPIVRLLKPQPDDYFVLKPKHSGFFSTTLDTLLDYLGVERVILTGITGDNCVLFTANDAYMRDLRLIVPADCVASISADDNRHALRQMERILKADTTPSTKLDLDSIKTRRP